MKTIYVCLSNSVVMFNRAFVDKDRANAYAYQYKKTYPQNLFTVKEIPLDEIEGML